MSFLKKVIGMAWDRPTFKNQVEAKIGGALFEFCKAEIAKANKQTRWVQHWQTEVKRLIASELIVVLLHTTSFKNKNKAFHEVLASLQKIATRYAKSAHNALEKNYFKKKLTKTISDEKLNEFFEHVKMTAQPHFD